MGSEHEDFQLKNSRGMIIRGVIDHPKGKGPFAVAVICHGLTGFKEQRLLHDIATLLNTLGILCVRFDFTNEVGKSDGKLDDLTIHQEVKDLTSVMDFVKTLPVKDTKSIGVVGHSLGGYIAMLAAAKDKRIKYLITIGAPYNPSEGIKNMITNAGETFENFKKKGFMRVQHGKHQLRLTYEVYKEAKKHDMAKIVKKLNLHLLLIHGMKDATVPIEDAYQIEGHLKTNHQKFIDKSAGHLFTKKEERKRILEIISRWAKRHWGK